MNSKVSSDVEGAQELERRELEAKYPLTMKYMDEVISEPPSTPIAGFAGFFVLLVAITLWIWYRLHTSKGKRPKKKNDLSDIFSAIDTRSTVVIAILWLICILLWGYIWRWESTFTGNEFSALILAGPLISGFGWAGLRWIRASKK